MLKSLCVLTFAASACASTLSQPAVKPLLDLRGGAYPPPKAGYHALAAKGAAASSLPVVPNLPLLVAGCYVAFGAILSITIASGISVEGMPGVQKLVFGALFPIALLNIIATGSQLFTGNTASVAAAYYEGLIEPSALIRNWVVTYAGNLLGSLVFAWAIKYSGLLTGTTAKMAAKIAAKCGGASGRR